MAEFRWIQEGIGMDGWIDEMRWMNVDRCVSLDKNQMDGWMD